jgi:hypothetical protein
MVRKIVDSAHDTSVEVSRLCSHSLSHAGPRFATEVLVRVAGTLHRQGNHLADDYRSSLAAMLAWRALLARCEELRSRQGNQKELHEAP